VYVIKNKEVSPGKCLAISRKPGTISHEVEIINKNKKLEPMLPWKYEGKQSIVLPPIKLFNWNEIDNQEKLLTANEQNKDNSSQPSISASDSRRIERDLPNKENDSACSISTLGEKKPIALFDWNFKNKKDKVKNLRNKNKEKRIKKKNKNKKEKIKKQRIRDRLENLKNKEKKIEEGIEKKRRLESAIQTSIALNEEKIKEKKKINEKLKMKSNRIQDQINKNKNIKNKNIEILNITKRFYNDIKKQKNINSKGYKVACERQTRRWDQEIPGLAEWKRDKNKQPTEIAWNPWVENEGRTYKQELFSNNP